MLIDLLGLVAAGTAYDQPANFILGDAFTFDVDEVGVGNCIDKIDTYSATFQQGALHSTSRKPSIVWVVHIW